MARCIHNLLGKVAVLLIASVVVTITEKLGAQQRSVVYGVVTFQRTVGYQEAARAFSPMKVIENELARCQRNLFVASVTGDFPGFKKCAGAKRSSYDGRGI